MALSPVGDQQWERLFRMCATLCLHRGLADAELETLPTGCQLGRALAGAPVVVYYSRGIPAGLVSCDPCHDPRRQYIIRGKWPVWIPIDCGGCPPCTQRIQIEADPLSFVRDHGGWPELAARYAS